MELTLDNNDVLEIEKFLNKEALKHLNAEENLGYYHFGIIGSDKNTDEIKEFSVKIMKHTNFIGCTFYNEPFVKIKDIMTRIEHFNKRCLKILLFLSEMFTKENICTDKRKETLWEFLSKPNYLFKNRIITICAELSQYDIPEGLQSFECFSKTNFDYQKFVSKFCEDDIEIVQMKNEMEVFKKSDAIRKLKQQLYPIIKAKVLRQKEIALNSNMVQLFQEDTVFDDSHQEIIIKLKPRRRAWTSFDMTVVNNDETVVENSEMASVHSKSSNTDTQTVIKDPLQYPDETSLNLKMLKSDNEYELTESSEWTLSYNDPLFSTDVEELSYSGEIPKENVVSKWDYDPSMLEKHERKLPIGVQFSKKSSYGTLKAESAGSDSMDTNVTFYLKYNDKQKKLIPLLGYKHLNSSKTCCYCCKIQ